MLMVPCPSKAYNQGRMAAEGVEGKYQMRDLDKRTAGPQPRQPVADERAADPARMRPRLDAGASGRGPAVAAQRDLGSAIQRSASMLAQRHKAQALDHAPRVVVQRQRLRAAFGPAAPDSQAAGLLQRRAGGGTAVIQLFDAGNGAQWHIHYGHIKLGNNVNSRVDFNGRNKKAIRKDLGDTINRYGLNVGGDLAASFRECINYINANY